MSEVARATVSLGLACDNACVFCGQSALERGLSSRAVITEALVAARATHDEVTLVGGEPALHPELADVVREARELGFARVGVQTNGAAPGLGALAGITDLHLSIHGATAAAHDYHTGREGSFAAALETLASARARSLDVVVTTVLTRSNARGMSDVARLLAARRVSAWCIAVPRVRGRAADLFDRVVPRLGIAMPFALHAVQTATSLDLPVFVRGAPLCVLGPFARYSLAEAERAHGAPCESCPARLDCPGVEPEYLARFDGDELSPRESVPAITNPLARMFVGPGELSAARGVAMPDAPTKARVALPMAGKVKPALAEVGRTAERKTGAALRELFKDLYTDEPRD